MRLMFVREVLLQMGGYLVGWSFKTQLIVLDELFHCICVLSVLYLLG